MSNGQNEVSKTVEIDNLINEYINFSQLEYDFDDDYVNNFIKSNYEDYISDDNVVVTSTTYPETCQHGNGWWQDIGFWIFKKHVFVCTDCCTVLSEDKTYL